MEKEYQLEQGDICIIKKGQKFSYTNESSEDVKLLLVHTPMFDLKEEVFE